MQDLKNITDLNVITQFTYCFALYVSLKVNRVFINDDQRNKNTYKMSLS